MSFLLLRYSIARCAVVAIAACATAVVLAPLPVAAQVQALARAQKLPDISTWKVVTSEEVGVSLLMPPETIVSDPRFPYDAKNGARVVSVLFEGPETNNEQPYGLVALRANRAALEGLRAKPQAKGATATKAPIDRLYAAHFKPLIDDAIGVQRFAPNRTSVTRKPIMWHGMKGEEIQITKRATKNRAASLMRLLVVKNENSIFLVSAGEQNPTQASALRTRRFFASLTIMPGDPFAPKPSTPKSTEP